MRTGEASAELGEDHRVSRQEGLDIPHVAAPAGGLFQVIEVVGADTENLARRGYRVLQLVKGQPLLTELGRGRPLGQAVPGIEEPFGIGREAAVAGSLDIDGRVPVDKDQPVGDDSDAHGDALLRLIVYWARFDPGRALSSCTPSDLSVPASRM